VHFEDLPVKNVEIVLIGIINCQTDRTNALLGKTLDIHLPAGGDALNKTVILHIIASWMLMIPCTLRK